jgi:hypothetical protein
METPRFEASAPIRWTCAGFLLASALLAAGPANLSGTWKLNKELSDDAHQKMDQARKAQGDVPPSSGGARGAWRGGANKDGGPRDPAAFAKAWATLTIHHEDPRLVIADGAGHEHFLYTDGREIAEERPRRGTVEIAAHWDEDRVVVEMKPERGPSRTETYSVAADGSQLTVVTRIEAHGPMPEITVRRVYDAVKEN